MVNQQFGLFWGQSTKVTLLRHIRSLFWGSLLRHDPPFTATQRLGTSFAVVLDPDELRGRTLTKHWGCFLEVGPVVGSSPPIWYVPDILWVPYVDQVVVGFHVTLRRTKQAAWARLCLHGVSKLRLTSHIADACDAGRKGERF